MVNLEKCEDARTRASFEEIVECDIFIMQMGVSVGTHVGLGAISMFFIEKGNK